MAIFREFAGYDIDIKFFLTFVFSASFECYRTCVLIVPICNCLSHQRAADTYDFDSICCHKH